MLVDFKTERMKFIETLACPICLSPFDQVPKVLPQCGHSFCSPCLEQWMLASSCLQHGHVSCPVCKCPTSLNLSPDLVMYFRFAGHAHFDDREYETECVINYLVDKFLPVSPVLSDLFKSCKKRNLFSKKPHRKALKDTFDKLLKCPVCREDFEEKPRMVPSCLHSVCMNCLRRSYKRSDEEFGFISCPCCWSVHRFRSDCNESIDSEGKYGQKIEAKPPAVTRGPSQDRLGCYLPFDYTLCWLLENAPVIRKELGV